MTTTSQPVDTAPPGDTAEHSEARAGREQAIVKSFRVIYQSIQRHSAWVEKMCGVSAAQLWAMWVIHRDSGLRVSDLSRALAIHASTASNMLDKLEDKGLIVRRRGGSDHRTVKLSLTRRGEKLLADAPRPAQGALIDALHALSDGQIISLHRGLTQLTRHLQVKDDASALKPLAAR